MGFKIKFNFVIAHIFTTSDKINNKNCIPACPLGLWGRDCQQKCLCQNNSTCDPYNGKCHCSRGWVGKYCESKCTPGTYGQDCLEKCRCEHGDCDHVSGECHCAPGWTGPLYVYLYVQFMRKIFVLKWEHF